MKRGAILAPAKHFSENKIQDGTGMEMKYHESIEILGDGTMIEQSVDPEVPFMSTRKKKFTVV